MNNPDDPGGETNYGITRQEATDNGWTGDMHDIPFTLVCSIYKAQYWDKVMGDGISDQEIATEVFDTAVNCGTVVAVRFLQTVLNALNGKQSQRWPDLVTDGVMGNMTMFALNAALAYRPYMRLIILRAIDSLQCVLYLNLAKKNKKYKTFMSGWIGQRCGISGQEVG